MAYQNPFNPGMTGVDQYLQELTKLSLQKAANRGQANGATRASMPPLSVATPHGFSDNTPGTGQQLGNMGMGMAKDIGGDMAKGYLKDAMKGFDFKSLFNAYPEMGTSGAALASGASSGVNPEILSGLGGYGADAGIGATDAATGMDWASLLDSGMLAL